MIESLDFYMIRTVTIALMRKRQFMLIILLVWFTLLTSCDSGEDAPTLVVDQTQISFGGDGGTKSIDISTSASGWSISNPVSDWLTLSSTEGQGNTARITLTVSTRTLQPAFWLFQPAELPLSK